MQTGFWGLFSARTVVSRSSRMHALSQACTPLSSVVHRPRPLFSIICNLAIVPTKHIRTLHARCRCRCRKTPDLLLLITDLTRSVCNDELSRIAISHRSCQTRLRDADAVLFLGQGSNSDVIRLFWASVEIISSIRESHARSALLGTRAVACFACFTSSRLVSSYDSYTNLARPSSVKRVPASETFPSSDQNELFPSGKMPNITGRSNPPRFSSFLDPFECGLGSIYVPLTAPYLSLSGGDIIRTPHNRTFHLLEHTTNPTVHSVELLAAAGVSRSVIDRAGYDIKLAAP